MSCSIFDRIVHTHRDVKPYQCAHCDYRSTVSGNVNKHCRLKHPGKMIVHVLFTCQTPAILWLMWNIFRSLYGLNIKANRVVNVSDKAVKWIKVCEKWPKDHQADMIL